MTLWNYYTKDHNNVGYNIQFDVSTLVHSLLVRKLKKECGGTKQYIDSISCHYGKVIYNKNIQIGILKKIIDNFSKAVTSWNDDVMYLLVDKIIWVGTFFKNPYFQHEYEYRMAFFTYTNQDDKKVMYQLKLQGKAKTI